MFAGEIVGILETKAACLPGSRDLEGRPLIIVHIPTELQPWTKDNLDLTLQYFSSIFSQETRRRGFTVIVDGQKGSWRVARACIRHVGLCLGPDLANLIVLRPDAFWDKQRVDNCTKIRKEGEPIYIPISRLHKYVDNSQLTEDLGGTWAYNHSQWIQNRLCVEFYMKEAKNALFELENFHKRLTEFTSGERLSTSTDPFVFSKRNFDTNKIIAQKVFQSGRELLNQIEKSDKECQRANANDYKTPQDAIDTKDKIEKLLEVIEGKQEAIDNSWLEMEKKCVDAREITMLETGVARVTKWILETAETMLNSQQEVGYDVPSSEELRAEHEALELQCRETYGQYAELLHKIDTLPQLNIKIPEDLKSQRDFMDFVCRSFATRLERRRNILITCLRFYRLVTEYFERTSEVFETLVMCTDVDSLESADCSLQELQENQTNIDFLAKELVKEGEKLSDMLSMPVKDALGRDVDVNYENDIVNVQEILEATLSRKQLFSDSVDLQKLTLEQVTHIHVYEKDAKQAVQWLNDLFQVMMKEYIHVGCNVHEIQMMKEEHQAFQETAKGTYEYGCQLLNAALALRHSCKLSEEYNIELTQNLWQAWKRLQNVGQEQMTRLRVSAVFHRSVEEHCKQLRELKGNVLQLTKLEDSAKKRSKLRKFLHTRERLLLEVGRMVRLGRLLRTRLKEPVCPDQVSLNEGHLTSVEAITEKLSEVTNLAEQLDAALSSAQSEGSSTPVTPNIKKILDGTASTTPEEWYSNLKSNSGKTPNTSSDSKSEDEFVTASECTCTPPSRSSSFQTASEGGAISPWWELDAASDSEGKTKTESSSDTVRRMVRSPVRITSEVAPPEVVPEEPKVTTGESLGVAPYLLENSSKLLRPDMTQLVPEPVGHSTESCAEEIVRHLSQIVKTTETYPINPEECSESEKIDLSEVSKSTMAPEYRYDGDTSSQYSLELLNAEFNPVLPPQNHSKSQSFETDNTDMSLPKFNAEIPLTSQPEIPKFDDRYKPEARGYPVPKPPFPKSERRDFSFPQKFISDESSKIYIIDASTPSPKSKRYVDSSLDSLELYQEPIRKIVEAEIHHQEDSAKTVSDLNEEDFSDRVRESDEWFQLKLLDVQPELTKLGETLTEAKELLKAHQEVLRQLESKQSPVEELLRQADQLISTQRPRAEVYAAMAESLGLAWKDVNNHLEERKQILEMNVNYKREEQNCLQKIEQLELTCLDAPVPVEIESVKHLLTKLHSNKRVMLESLMVTLQEGKLLLERLRKIAKEGTLDSRPDNIKVNAERAVSKVEHWLEALHDKRKLIEVIWQSRKTQVEQCLALALLATELLDVETILKSKKESLLRSRDNLGDSKASVKVLLEELSKILTEAKDLQDRTLKITNSTEKLVNSGHFAGEQAISQSYSVLNECAEYLNSIDKREELLDKAVTFFDAADNAFNRLDIIQKRLTTTDLPSSSSALSELHTELVDAMEESTEPAIIIGNELLDAVGHNAPGAEGVRNTLDELRSRRINLEGICTAKQEQKLQVSQSVNNFLEKHNEMYSWLITTVEAFLQGHQDMGSVLPISRDYLNLHSQLLNELRIKETEFKSLLSTVPSMVDQLSNEERRDLEEKVKSFKDLWMTLNMQLENRIDLARTYVKFHASAVDLTNKYDLIEDDFKKRASVTDEDIRQIEEKCLSAQQQYVQLSHLGKNFIQDSGKVMDQYLDVKRASLCIETILEQFAGRQSAVTESWRSWQSDVDVKKQMKIHWARHMADCNKTLDWVTKIQPQLYPILLEDYETCEDVIRELERKEKVVIPEVRRAETDIETRIKDAESLALSGEAPPDENKKVVKELMDVHEQLQTTLTEYQVLIQMLQSFFKNLAEVEKTIQKINKQNQVAYLSNNVQEIESVIKEHEAYCQAVTELFKFTKTESESIINKINSQEPETVRESDVNKIKGYLNKKQRDFEAESSDKKLQLEQHRQVCQFDEDLKEINGTLSDLNDQLISIRGQYGESLTSAKATSQAFVYFEKTIELLEQRIKTFIESGEDLLKRDHSSSVHVEKELNQMRDKWNSFHDQVRESRRLIDLSIQYFKLVEEAEEWFKEGSRLLVTIARKTSSVRKPEEATELLNEVATFLKPGELRQDERIRKIGDLANQLFGEQGSRHMNPVLTENREMIDSFTLISEELNRLAVNLKESEEERERLKQEQKEIDASLSAVKAEALAAKAAATAAEEARRAAELAAKVLRESTYTTRIEKIEIEQVTSMIEKSPSPAKKPKTEDVAPEFVLPLRDATVREGEKFKFECRVTGNPTPDIVWLKEGIPVENNPDYQTKFDADEGICSLDIEETFAEDTATFTCKATNSAGTAETNALLTVAETVLEEILTPPKFTEPLKPGTCKEGGTYELSCFVEGYPLPTVQWFKGQTCVDSSPDYVITYNNGEAKLRFDQVFLEDQSEYTCKATNSVGTEETTAYFTVEPLEPTAAPEVIQPLSNVMVRAGQKVKLECEVHGIPEPEISWHRDGRPIKTNHDVTASYQDNIASLSIAETFPKDGGVYTMTAKNIVGEATSNCNVTVKGLLPNETSDSEMASDVEPTKPSIQLELKDQTVFEGKTVLLECIIVGQPEPEVIWYHDGVPVIESDDFLLLFQGDHCSLLIKDVYVEDAGNYKVVAINSAGEASSSCNLSVIPVKSENAEPEDKVVIEEIQEPGGEQPKFTKLLTDILADEGEKVKLECCVTADPEPDIRWYLNNKLIEVTEKVQMDEDAEGNVSLTLLDVSPEDKGVYTVKATNTFGEAKCFAQLIVKEKPKMMEPQEEKNTPPVFTKKFEDVTVKENEEAKFECAVEGKPTPQVKWMLNDEPISGDDFKISSRGNSHELIIPKVSKNETGNVSCVAENEAGRAVYSAKLSVRDSSLHREFKLVPFIEPIVSQETMESSTFSTKRQVVMESTTSTNKTITSSGMGEPQVEVHSYSSRDQKSMKQVDQRPVEEVVSHESKEFHQINDETPVRKEDSSMIVSAGGQVIGELTKSDSLMMVGPKLSRKSTVPRFVTPVQGKIVDQGSDVELEGVIEGYPPPTVTWSKNGVDIEPVDEKIEITFELNHAKLKIYKVDSKDSGRYSCKAANSVGTATSTTDLVVKKTVFPPVLGKRLQAQTVPKGERAKLEVEVTGTPEPTVTWYKDDVPIKSSSTFRIVDQGNSHSIIIEKASDEHSGRYMVKATNAGGMTQSIADLLVCETGPVENYSSITNIHDKISSAIQLKPQVVDKQPEESIRTVQKTSEESMSMTETTKTQKIIRVKLERELSPGVGFKAEEKTEPEEKTEKIVTVHLPAEESTEEIDRTSIPKQSSLDFFKTKIKESEEEAKKQTESPKPKPISLVTTSEEVEVPPAPEVFTKQSEIVSQLKTVQKVDEEVKPVEKMAEDAISRAQESYSMVREEKSSFSKYETVEKKIEKIEPIFKKPQSNLKLTMPPAQTPQNDFELHPEPPPEIGFIPKMEKVKIRDDISEKVKKLEEFHKVGSPVDIPSGGVRLLPIVFPKPEPQPQPEPEVKEVKKVEKEKVIETLPPLSWLSDEPYSKEDKEVLQSTLSFSEKKETETISQKWGERVQPMETQPPQTFSTTQSTLSIQKDLRPTSPRPSAEGLAMEKLWACKKPYEDFKPLSEPETLKPTGVYRPSSSLEPMRAASPRPSAEGVAMEKLWVPQKPIETSRPASSLGFINRCSSPRPSQEGIAMDKIWAHRHKESNLKVSWPPQQPKEEKPLLWTKGQTEVKWPPEQSSTEVTQQTSEIKSEETVTQKFQETTFPKAPISQPFPKDAPVTHYIAESRLIRQTQSMDRQIKYISESSSTSTTQQHYLIEDSITKPMKKVWPPSDLQAPTLVKQVTEQKTTAFQSGGMIEPGPPPEIGFASRPEVKTSYVETVEKDLKKDLYKTPSRQLPGAVRIIPTPKKTEFPKKEIKRSSSLDSKPFERFPDLEPFPFKPDPPKPKPAKCPPPPTPTKFVKCRPPESDYESDYDSRISVKWRPYESDGEEIRFRQVRPPSTTIHPRRPQSTEPEPLPPSKFENPPEFTGPPRPVIDTSSKKISTQTKKEILRGFSENKEAKKKIVKVKTISPPKVKPGSPPEFVHAPRPKPEPIKPKPVKPTTQFPESGYMADTDEPFVLKQKMEKSTAVREFSSTKRTVYENYTDKSSMEFSSPRLVQETGPELEPFPYKVEPVKQVFKKVVPPPPTPSKFVKNEFKESDYESDYDARIQAVWNSEGRAYKPVRPVLTPSGRHTYSSTGRTPTPPTEFDVPPPMEGSARPKFEPIAPESRLYSDDSQMLIKPKPLTPKVIKPDINLKPGSPPELAFAPAYPKAVETSNVMSFQEDTETSRRVVNVQQTTRLISFGEKKEKSAKYQESTYGTGLDGMHYKDSPFKKFRSVDGVSKTNYSSQIREPDIILQPGEPPELVYSKIPVTAATSYASQHIKDMTQTFKSKAQQFVSDVMTDTRKPDKPILKSSVQSQQNGTPDEPHTYREESRLSEKGTKHIDPDTGLIYFKYDFGYEFGVVLPGEGGGKTSVVSGGTKPAVKSTARRESIDFPVLHETTKKDESTAGTRPKKYIHFKSVKWEPMSESEMSEAEEYQRKRTSLPTKAPQVTIPGNRWESTPSPLSISPMSSLSPKCQRSTPLDLAGSPTWMRSGTPTSTTPGLNQRSVMSQSREPLKAPSFITPLRDIAVVSGQPARFECIVQAEPTPNVLWSKDGRILDNDQFHDIQYKNGVCRLTILQAFPADAGTYTCTATNMVGTTETTSTLQVPGERRGVRTNY